MRWEHLTDGNQNTCLQIFNCLQAERGTKKRRPLLQMKTKRLMLPARSWKRSWQLGICRGNANRSTLPTANQNLFADLEVFTSGGGDEATSPSFTDENEAIGASSSSLEALNATRYMHRGCDGSTLPTANKIPVCRSLSVYKRRGRRGKVVLFYSRKRSDWCFQLVAGSAYCNSVYAQGMPWEHFTDGN